MPIPDPNADEYGHQTPTLTVADVIEALQAFDGALPVSVEGCDCVGDAGAVSLEAGRVLIERTTHVYPDED